MPESIRNPMGLYVGHCSCGWISLRRTSPVQKCEACENPLSYPRSPEGEESFCEWDDGNFAMATWVATCVDLRASRLIEIVARAGYFLYPKNKTKWMLFQPAGFRVIKWPGLGEQRAISNLDLILEADYPTIAKKVQELIPNLPKYLHEKD